MLKTLGLLMGFLCLSVWAQAQDVQFNYNGRVNVLGAPFEGEGHFKLALTNYDGTVTYWANDGVTLDGNEPTTAVTITITDGFFSVDVGDTALAGMAQLNASIFNTEGEVYLRTWFNDGNSGFQRLLPDRKVVNPALLGLFNSDQNSTIYVDPVAGNDGNSGLTTDTAKRTIQSAWDTIPPLVRRDIMIQLLNGTYREQADLSGKTAIGRMQITVRGNPTSPTQVRVTGADAGNEALAVRESGFTVSNQRNLTITGVALDHQAVQGIRVDDGSKLNLSKVIIHDQERMGVYVTNLAHLDLRDSEFYATAYTPIWIDMNSIAEMFSTHVHDCAYYLMVANAGCLNIFYSRFSNMSIAVQGHANALISYSTKTPWTVFENCAVGTQVINNSSVFNAYNWCTYINTPTKVVLGAGSPVANQ